MPTPSSETKRLAWEEKIRLRRESGLSIERWCRENQVSPHTFHYWKDRLFPKVILNRSCFTELADARASGISIECQGILIHLDKHFEPSTLKRFLAVLKEMKC